MFRKTVSLTGFLSFALLLFTSVVLYYQPHGRVAYWADWRFLGLAKDQWDALHLSLGALFLFSALLHIWYNWKSVTNYMRNKARELIVLTPPLVAALAVTLYFTAGALFGLPGVRQILDFSAFLKNGHTATYGNPPYGHAELSSLDEFAKNMGFDPLAAMDALHKRRIEAAPESTIQDIAVRAGRSPQEIYAAIRAGLGGDPFEALPGRPPEGTGLMTLAELCESYALPPATATERLRMAGVEPALDIPFRDLAQKNGMSPKDLYETLRTGRPQ
ncbi:MAG: DUF4405 domain-containing protein [Desulfovibrio sp.]